MSRVPDCAEALGGLSRSLADLKGLQRNACDALYAGDYTSGGQRMRTLFSAWNEFLQGVSGILPALEEGAAARTQQSIAASLAYLKAVRGALERRDWIQTADLLSLDVVPVFEGWDRALAPELGNGI